MFAALALGAAALLASCAQQPVARDHFYRLETSLPARSFQQVPISGMIAVDRPQADSLLGQRAILYSDAQRPAEILQYSYHYWTKTPPRIVQEQLAKYLRGANVAERIAHEEERDLAGCRLTGVIHRFERVVAGTESSAVIELQMRLTRFNDHHSIWAGNYRATAPAASSDMHAVVDAFSVAMDQLFGALLIDLGAAPNECPPPLR